MVLKPLVGFRIYQKRYDLGGGHCHHGSWLPPHQSFSSSLFPLPKVPGALMLLCHSPMVNWDACSGLLLPHISTSPPFASCKTTYQLLLRLCQPHTNRSMFLQAATMLVLFNAYACPPSKDLTRRTPSSFFYACKISRAVFMSRNPPHIHANCLTHTTIRKACGSGQVANIKFICFCNSCPGPLLFNARVAPQFHLYADRNVELLPSF